MYIYIILYIYYTIYILYYIAKTVDGHGCVYSIAEPGVFSSSYDSPTRNKKCTSETCIKIVHCKEHVLFVL